MNRSEPQKYDVFAADGHGGWTKHYTATTAGEASRLADQLARSWWTGRPVKVTPAEQ